MFDIIIRPSVLHVDCFTACVPAYEYAPIENATKFYPEWWKKLPKESLGHQPKPWIPQPTMKSCQGFIDSYRNSLIMPMWSDTLIKVNENNLDVTFSHNWFHQSHDYFQREGYLKNFHHLKIISPWIFKTKQDIYWSFKKPIYNFENPLDFLLFEGVIEFKYQHSTNINIGIKKINKTIKLNFRDPIVLLTPHTEKKIKFKNHFVDSMEKFQMLSDKASAGTVFVGKYLNNRRIKKQQEQEKKCPFHF